MAANSLEKLVPKAEFIEDVAAFIQGRNGRQLETRLTYLTIHRV